MINFNEETHTYTNEEGKVLISVTQLLRVAGIAPNYDSVNSAIMKKASEYGTLIHKDLETYIKTGIVGISNEVINFSEYVKANSLTPVLSEFMLNNEVLAGTVDLLYKDKDEKLVISDFKTTSVIHTNSVTWQLSIYKYLYEKTFDDKITKGTVIHFDKDGKLEEVELQLKSTEQVEKLISWYLDHKEGSKYEVQVLTDNQIAIKHRAIEIIKNCQKQLEEAQLELDLIKDVIVTAMKENGLTSYKDDEVKISIVAPSTKKTVDTKKLKEKYPDIYEECSKETKQSEQIRMGIIGEK